MNFKKQRRSGRLTKMVPVLLVGSDSLGRAFSEETHTVILSQHGAGIVCSHKLLSEQELLLRSPETNREVEVRIVGDIGSQGEQFTYGVAFIDEDLDFWQLDFPPPPSLNERPLELVLECGGCNASIKLLNGDYEFDVCAIHGGLVRYCTECGYATVWKRPELGAAKTGLPNPERRSPERQAPVLETAEQRSEAGNYIAEDRAELFSRTLEEFVPPPALTAPLQRAAEHKLPGEVKSVATIEERRGRVRAKVNYFACVRSKTFGEDVVQCIDMSRRGLGFRSKNPYLISAEVTIAVPFSPESPNAPAIYVAARVVNLREVRERGAFRIGVEFLPVAGSQAHR